MSSEEIHKLLGGYATDTLTEAERRALFAAALEDQELFDALAKEDALREVLQEPIARQQVLEALGSARVSAGLSIWQWVRHPAVLAVAGGVAILIVTAGLELRRSRTSLRRAAIVAQMRTPVPKVFEPAPALPGPQITKAIPKPPALEQKREISSVVPPQALSAGRLSEPLAPGADFDRGSYAQSETQGTRLVRTAPKMSVRKADASPTAAAAGTLSMQYSLLLKGADGDYAPTSLDNPFRVGDLLRLQLVPNGSGSLYLFQRDPHLHWKLASSEPVSRGESYYLPARGALQFRRPGRNELLVLLSSQPDPSLESFDAVRLDVLAATASADVPNATVVGAASGYVGGALPQAGGSPVTLKITLEFR